VFAHDPDDAALAGIEVGNAQPGEWYAVPELVSSPLAADQAGADFSGLPPVSALLPRLGEYGAAPLSLQRNGSGREEAALALVRNAGRRRAVVLASGFWRWGFREGRAREAYRRLWAAVSGWLLANEALAGGPGVRPAPSVAARDRPVRWVAPGLAGDTVRLTLRRGDQTVSEMTVAVPAEEAFESGPLPPGAYEYVVDGGPGTEEEASGLLDIESYTDELLLAPAELEAVAGDVAGETSRAAPAGRPFRTLWTPYLVLVILLCAEWVGRRRLGLR
jgi:hypothetical protein